MSERQREREGGRREGGKSEREGESERGEGPGQAQGHIGTTRQDDSLVDL